jgi:putative membrane protein
MSTPSEPFGATADLPPVEDRRLHPLSWLFVLLQQLRSFAIPLVVLLVTGRGGSNVAIPLIGVGGLVVVSVIQYFSYRYRTDQDGFIIASGVLQRTRRDIPYERIHTVNLHQSLLHRLFDVVELRLESAGGKDAEAVMRVLSMTDARALEQLVRERGAARRGGAGAAAAGAMTAMTSAVVAPPLLALNTGEVIRLGLISNRGMVVVAALVGAVWQFADDVRISSDNVPAELMAWTLGARDYLTAHLHDVVGLALVGLLLLVPALAAVRLLSVALALLQYHGFTVTEADRQLRVERGLLSRVRNQLPKRRIQAWRIDETLLHRWFGRQTLRVDSAAGGDDDHGVRYLAPVATPGQVRALIDHLLPADPWPPTEWRPVDGRAWRRLFVVPALCVAAATAGVTWYYGAIGALLLFAVPVLLVRARTMARFAAYAATDRTVSVRDGWLNRSWGLAEVRKLQALRLTQSPFDRRLGMATIWLDTAGASSGEGVLRIRFLPQDEARDLHDRIAGLMDGEGRT